MKLGQHVLREEAIKKFIEAAEVKPSDIVFEIGAGPGNLTREIAKRCKKVIAIEIDRRFENHLNEIVTKEGNVEVIFSDVLSLDLQGNKIISNLPFEISSPITDKVIMYLNKKGGDATLIYQLEFARKMVARGKEFSRISFLCQYYAETELIYKIPKGSFEPHPRVDCAVVKIRPTGKRIDKDLLDFVNILFQQKNKKVINSLLDSRSHFRINDKKELKRKLMEILSDEVKVWELGIEEIIEIYDKLKHLIAKV